MSRKGQTKLRKIDADPIYNSETVSRLINYSMRHGIKTAAAKQIYLALEILKKESKSDDVLATLEQSFDAVRPKVEVRPRRIGGAVYQVPTPVRGHRQMSLAVRWMITAARAQSSKLYHTFGKKLASQLLAGLKNEGNAVIKRQEVERMAEANKAFAHLRW